jgi:hypothetical protein
VLHQIGVGALGPVFRTYEPERDRLVAVKAFRLDITPEQAQSLADELSRAAEAGLFHPSIVEPIAAGVEGSVAYHAEEYVAAESLDVAMRHYAPAPPETVLPFITQLAGAIDFARAAGVGHGALHPRDVFMTPDEARATGFGVVEALERVGLRAPIRRPYSPPERIAGAAWSTEADIFSLAAITYELLTGRRPAGLGAEIGPMAGVEQLHDVLARAMDEDPSRRYPTALSFASALESAVHGRSEPLRSSDLTRQVEHSPAGPLAGAAAVAASVPPGPSARPDPELAAADDVLRQEIEDDIAGERDDDEAYHRVTQDELELVAAGAPAVEHEAELGMDEDSEVEAEADRYAGDDFLLDAAGAASVPDSSGLASFSPAADGVDARALEDDELIGDEAPTHLFQPEDRLHEPAAPQEPAATAQAHHEPRAHVFQAPAPSLGGFASPLDHTLPAEPRSIWPLALTLVLGLLLGFIGGYAVWGRAGSPDAREWSEQAVAGAPPAAAPGDARPGGPGGTSGKVTAPAAGPAGGAPAAPPPDAASGAEPAPRATTGTLVVRSTPNGAGVTVNGRWRGRTPLTLEKLPFARYDVRVVQPGYTTASEAITLSATDPARSVSLRLAQASRPAPAARAPSSGRPAPSTRPATPDGPEKYTGAIYVDSRPRGARVFIDGKPVGATPLSLPEVPIGSHVVRLELPDHRIWSTTARVTAGQQARVTGSLERIP